MPPIRSSEPSNHFILFYSFSTFNSFAVSNLKSTLCRAHSTHVWVLQATLLFGAGTQPCLFSRNFTSQLQLLMKMCVFVANFVHTLCTCKLAYSYGSPHSHRPQHDSMPQQHG